MQIDGAGRIIATIQDHHAGSGHNRFVVLELFLFLPGFGLITHPRPVSGGTIAPRKKGTFKGGHTSVSSVWLRAPTTPASRHALTSTL